MSVLGLTFLKPPALLCAIIYMTKTLKLTDKFTLEHNLFGLLI